MSRIFLFYLFFDMFPVFFNTRNKEFCEVIRRDHIAFGIVANHAGKLRISRHHLVYLEEFAPDVERSEFERRVCNLFENKWMIDLNEQRTLINKVAEDEKKLACIEQTSLDLKTLLKVLRSSTSFEELTPTLVNSMIRRIEVHNNDKSSGHCYVKVDIYFTAIGLIDIPTEDEIKSFMAKIKANPQEYRLTA